MEYRLSGIEKEGTGIGLQHLIFLNFQITHEIEEKVDLCEDKDEERTYMYTVVVEEGTLGKLSL